MPWGPIQQSSQSTAGFRLHLVQICCPKSICFEPNWQDFPVQHPKHALTVHGRGCSQGCTKPVTPGNSKLQLRDELTAVSPPRPHVEECYEQCLSFFYRSCSPSKKERLTLLRRKFGNNLLLVRYKPQQGQLLLFPKCVMIHM